MVRESKTYGPPDGNLILVIAETYGRSPEEVEHWDAYWFERAVAKLRGQTIHDQKKSR